MGSFQLSEIAQTLATILPPVCPLQKTQPLVEADEG